MFSDNSQVQLTTAIKSLFLISIAKILPVAGFLALNLYLAASLNVDDYGKYALAVSIIFFVGPLVSCGTSDVVLRKVSVYSYAGLTRLSVNLLSRSFNLTVVFSLILVASFSILTFLLNIENPFIYLMYCAPVVAFSGLISSKLRGLGKIALSQAYEAIFKIAVLLVFVMLTFLHGEAMDDIKTAFYIAALVTLLAVCFEIQLHALIESSFNKKNFRRYKRLAFNGMPYALINITQGVKNYADLLIVGLIIGPSAAGIYSLALQIVLVLSFGQMIISVLLSREISWSLRRSDMEKLRLTFRRSTYLACAIGLCYVLLVLNFGRYAIREFVGEEYLQAFDLVLILGIGRLFHLSVGPVMQLMSLSNNQLYASRISVMVAICNCFLSLLLVSVFGVYGAAMAGCVSIVMWSYLLKRQLAHLYPVLSIW